MKHSRPRFAQRLTFQDTSRHPHLYLLQCDWTARAQALLQSRRLHRYIRLVYALPWSQGVARRDLIKTVRAFAFLAEDHSLNTCFDRRPILQRWLALRPPPGFSHVGYHHPSLEGQAPRQAGTVSLDPSFPGKHTDHGVTATVEEKGGCEMF